MIHAPNLYAEALSLFNEMALSAGELCRVIGYAEDDEDCYYIVRMQRYPDGCIKWHSCVGGLIPLSPLRGQNQIKSLHTDETWDDYCRLEYQLRLNGAPEEPEFRLITCPLQPNQPLPE